MMKKYYKMIFLIGLFLCLMVVLVWAIAAKNNTKMARQPGPVIVKVKQPVLVYDQALVEKLNSLTRQLNFENPDCTYAGVINMIDGQDSVNTRMGIRFLFCRKNKDYYYQVGPTITIHRGGINIFIQQEQEKVVLSKRDVAIKAPVYDTKELEKQLRDENYALVSSKDSTSKTISIINDHHISCKELSASYDTVSGKLKRIYTRMSDITDPLNKKKDRQVEVLFSKMEQTGNLELYPAIGDVIHKVKGGWKLTEKYAKYELISL